LGIGQKLWSATRRAAVAAGVQTIDATIRADNVGGLKILWWTWVHGLHHNSKSTAFRWHACDADSQETGAI